MVFFLCLFGKLKVQHFFSCGTKLLTDFFKRRGSNSKLAVEKAQELPKLAMVFFALKNCKLSPRKCGVNRRGPSKTRALCVFQGVHLLSRLRTRSGLFPFTCHSTVTHTSFGCPSKSFKGCSLCLRIDQRANIVIFGLFLMSTYRELSRVAINILFAFFVSLSFGSLGINQTILPKMFYYAPAAPFGGENQGNAFAGGKRGYLPSSE